MKVFKTGAHLVHIYRSTTTASGSFAISSLVHHNIEFAFLSAAEN